MQCTVLVKNDSKTLVTSGPYADRSIAEHLASALTVEQLRRENKPDNLSISIEEIKTKS